MDLNAIIRYINFFSRGTGNKSSSSRALVEKCGYDETQPCWNWTIDAHDIEHSTIWNDSSSGLGGWGGQKNVHQIYSGGFKGQIWVYPSPHRILRKFAAFPYADPAFSAPGNGPLPMLADSIPNTTMTLNNVALMVNGFDADFVGFQAYFEGLNVSGTSHGR